MKSLYSPRPAQSRRAAFLEPAIAQLTAWRASGIPSRDTYSAASADRSRATSKRPSSRPAWPCRRAPCPAVSRPHYRAGWRQIHVLFSAWASFPWPGPIPRPKPELPAPPQQSSSDKPVHTLIWARPIRGSSTLSKLISKKILLIHVAGKAGTALLLPRCRAAAASNERASCSGYPPPKTALPATKSSAPAWTISATVS